MIEGSLGVKLPTIFDRWKAETGRAREKRRVEERRSEKRKSQKAGKPRNTVFFQWFVAPEGGKVGSLKRRARSHLAKWKMKNCTPLWREAHFEVKVYKTHHCRTSFGSWDVEKVHAVVARSTFPSQNAQNTPLSDHFWKLRCRKSARRCGAKHISKSKCTKHTIVGPLLEVEMSKKCTPLARSTFRSENVKHTRGSDHFWRFRCCFAWQAQGNVHLVKSEKTWRFCSIFNHIHHYTTLHSNTLHYNYTFTTFHYTTLHYTPLGSTTLHYTQLHLITFNYTQLNHTTLHSTTLQYTTLHYTPLHYTTLHYITHFPIGNWWGGWDPGLISLIKRGPLQYGFSKIFQSNITSVYF